MKYQIINGNNIDVLKTFPDNHFDSIVTDPPYGIDFLGKSWDANTGALETYQECLRVLKPGGHIVAFSAARTYHHLAITLEQAGFEIRDQIMWIYSSGFPKSQDVGRSIQRSLGVKETKKVKSTDGYNLKNQKGFTENNDVGYGEMKPITVVTDPEAQKWEGWGTALKPAHEPIALARKPIKLSIAKNVQKWGTGALNIDATRVGDTGGGTVCNNRDANGKCQGHGASNSLSHQTIHADLTEDEIKGRFPSNVIGEIAEPYQKYFYCPKVSRKERHTGFELPPPMFGDVDGAYGPDGKRFAEGFDTRASGKTKKKKHDPLAHIPFVENSNGYESDTPRHTAKRDVGNNHPTVKPIELMKYLIKLVTPANGIVLDPFNGSGSTGCAAVELGHEYVGIELDPAYVEIAKKRIEAWNRKDTAFDELFGNG